MHALINGSITVKASAPPEQLPQVDFANFKEKYQATAKLSRK